MENPPGIGGQGLAKNFKVRKGLEAYNGGLLGNLIGKASRRLGINPL